MVDRQGAEGNGKGQMLRLSAGWGAKCNFASPIAIIHMTGRDRPIIDKVSSTFHLTFAPSPQLEVSLRREQMSRGEFEEFKKILEEFFYDFQKILEKFLYLSKVDLPASFIANSPLKDKVWFDDARLRKFFDYYRENEQPSLDALDETLVFCDPQTRFDLLGEPNNCRAFENHLQESSDSAWKEFRILSEYSEQHIQKQTRKTKVTVFPSARDLRWEEVSMTFVSDKVIKVRARKQLKEYRFDRIGFKNEKNGKPNRLWLLLKAFGARGGQLSWQDLSSTGMTANQVQSSVTRLRKILRNFMGIEDDPFHPYRKVKAYEAKFTITGDDAALIDSDEDAPESDFEAVYNQDVNRLH